MQLGSLDDVKDIKHPTYTEISKKPDSDKMSVFYESLCKLQSPFFTKF